MKTVYFIMISNLSILQAFGRHVADYAVYDCSEFLMSITLAILYSFFHVEDLHDVFDIIRM